MSGRPNALIVDYSQGRMVPISGRGGYGGGHEGGRGGGGGNRGRGQRGLAKEPLSQNEPTELCLIASSQTTVVVIARTQIRGAWVLWSQVEQHHRDAMYREFRSHFHFEPVVYDSVGYEAWEGYHQTYWSRWLNRMRSESNRRAGLPSNHEIIKARKAVKPEFVDQEYWDLMIVYWSTGKGFKKRSKVCHEAQTKQRVTYTAGGKPFTQCYMDLEKQLGRKASMLEKFTLTYSKRGGIGDWATPHCEEIANNFQQALDTLSQTAVETDDTDDQHPITPRREMETWIEQSGGRKKN